MLEIWTLSLNLAGGKMGTFVVSSLIICLRQLMLRVLRTNMVGEGQCPLLPPNNEGIKLERPVIIARVKGWWR